MISWSQYQKDIFDAIESTNDSLIIEAVAGSGKTTTIIEAIRHVPSTQSVAFLAFNKSIAMELKSRITQPNAKCQTLHALGLSAWKEFLSWDAANLEVDGKKTIRIVDEMELPFGKWTKEMTKLAGLAKGGGMVPLGAEAHCPGALAVESADRWEDLIERYDIDADFVDLNLVRDVLLRGIAKAKEVVDFDDMLYMPVIMGAKFEKADVVFLDEAQDVNGIQAEIVARMNARVVAVGDPNQSIYGFRGALSDSMSKIAERFKCRTLPLSVSYRCPKAVVKEARRWVEHIQHHEDSLEGKVEYTDQWNIRDFLPGDAILCRNAAPTIAVAFMLIRSKIPAKVIGRDIGQGLVSLVQKMKAKSILDLSERLEKYRLREVARLGAKNESKIAALNDKLETLQVFMAEAAPHDGIGRLILSIEAMFGEGADMRGMVTLSTIHKSKGLEFNRVFILDADLYMPSKYARQAWEKVQESNLAYVAATRAKQELYYISTDGLRTEAVRAQAAQTSNG